MALVYDTIEMQDRTHKNPSLINKIDNSAPPIPLSSDSNIDLLNLVSSPTNSPLPSESADNFQFIGSFIPPPISQGDWSDPVQVVDAIENNEFLRRLSSVFPLEDFENEEFLNPIHENDEEQPEAGGFDVSGSDDESGSDASEGSESSSEDEYISQHPALRSRRRRTKGTLKSRLTARTMSIAPSEILDDIMEYTEQPSYLERFMYGDTPGRKFESPEFDELISQDIVVDEELRIIITGYRQPIVKLAGYWLSFIVSGGIVGLLCYWMPNLYLWFTAVKSKLSSSKIIFVESYWGQKSVEKIESVDFHGDLEEIFPDIDSENPGFPVKTKISSFRAFDYRNYRFIFNTKTGKFQTMNKWKDNAWNRIDNLLQGIRNSETVQKREEIFGPNVIDIKEKSDFTLMVEEVLHPFFVFQIASIILWSMDDYYYYATCIFVVSVASMLITLIETKQTMKKLREMSRFTCDVFALRNNEWIKLSSEELVPGDLVLISNSNKILPCDALLLDGSCIINESMLTGESIPISKSPLTDEDLQDFDIGLEDPTNSQITRFFLHSGTKVIRVRNGNRQDLKSLASPTLSSNRQTSELHGAIAMVVRTGFNTTKGTLIRSMLYPRPNNFEFYRDSFRFIGVLTMIAGIGFVIASWQFILRGVHLKTVIIRAMDLITIVVPPALPATLLIGTSFAIERLKKIAIFCVSPQKVNVCGTLDIICFDKTGTLTEEGLDVLGFQFTVPNIKQSQDLMNLEDFASTRFSRLYNQVDDMIIPKSTTSPESEFERRRPKTRTNSYKLAITSNGKLNGAAEFQMPFPPDIPDFDSRAFTNFPPLPPHDDKSEFPYPLITCAMATCHSIKVVDGELIGDPLDIKMFEFTKWTIEEDEPASSSHQNLSRQNSTGTGSSGLVTMVVRPPGETFDLNRSFDGDVSEKVYTEFGVIRQFDFVSGLRRMGVVVRRLKLSSDIVNGEVEKGANKDMEFFVKGAPEVIKSICRADSIPANYDELLSHYAKSGYRVIALAWRVLSNISWIRVLRLSRSEVEKDLYFLGFVVFENKLKPQTTVVINQLNYARMKPVMCTGDNLLTAISVGKECGIVDGSSKVFSGRLIDFGYGDGNKEIVWEDQSDVESKWTLDSLSLEPIKLPNLDEDKRQQNVEQRDTSQPVVTFPNTIPSLLNDDNAQTWQETIDNYALAMTGDVFHHLLEFAPLDCLRRALIKGVIYARMSPEQKQQLVERLQEIGYCVGFCGDGANDCGALRSADVGLSLSEAEASVAAPFTTRQTELDCVPTLIQEGRAALVTSFACFQFMALYSIIQFTSVSILYYVGSNLGDLQFLFIDLAIIIPVASCMGYSKSYPKLHPKPPTAKLVSRKVLTSLILQIIVQIAIQFFSVYWVRKRVWYSRPDTDVEKRIFKCFENEFVFLVSCFQYIIVAVIVSTGPPYRENIWKNVPFVLTSLALTVVTIILVSFPIPIVSNLLDLMDIPLEGRMMILFIGLINLIFSLIVDKLCVPVISKLIDVLGLEILANQAPKTINDDDNKEDDEEDKVQRRKSNGWLIWGRNNGEDDLEQQQPLIEESYINSVKEKIWVERNERISWAKRERWRREGKLYKIVMHDFQKKSK
ncbi:hypothetical protein HK098_002204 [Nowakowskiella sp. JEL0407]|nr:hypothetical protein HK098_002204 [Nowakowskiella sp. JEL0407]